MEHWADVWPVLLLGLAVLAFAVVGFARLARMRRGPRSPPLPPVPVPPEEAELVEGPVWACLRCGSTDVGMGGVSQGLIPGAGDPFAFACRRCRHRGAPLEFEDVTAYRQFVKALHEGTEK